MRRLYLILLLLSFSAYIHAQVVKGKVINAVTGDPIANASVHLNGSSRGTTSNAQGEFLLYTDQTKMPLVISSIGYKPDSVYNYNGKNLTVKLSPRAQVLREVVIGDVIMTREKQMKIFLTQFIGSHNKECIISNPDDINFTYHKKTKTLEATVNQPLIIYNKMLGYKITYYLSAFSCSPLETSYKGNYVFAEDTLGLKPAEMKKILKARDKAYFGSRMHFIRSVWNNDLKKNKFICGNDDYNYNKTNYAFQNINANREKLFNTMIINNDINANRIEWINFTFTKGLIPIAYFNYDSGGPTYMTFQSRTKDVVLTVNSYNESNLVWSGIAARQRVGELLPLDFEPL